MTISTLLYVLAGILMIFIIASIAITRKFSLSDAIALLGIIVSIIFAQSISRVNSPSPIYSQTPESIATSLSTNPATRSSATNSVTETPNWAIIFEYRFPAGFWSIGTHEYTLEGNCPNLKDTDGNPLYGIWTQTFDVAENAALLPGDVYFRLSGLRDAPLDAQVVERINPQQTTTAAWSLIEMTQFDAELAVTDCTVTISWDGGTSKSLKPGLPFQR